MWATPVPAWRVNVALRVPCSSMSWAETSGSGRRWPHDGQW